jgi:hypothetical protein
MEELHENEPKPGFLSGQFDGFESTYPSDTWKNIESELDSRKKRPAFWWWFAGLIPTILGAWLAFQYLLPAGNQYKKQAIAQSSEDSHGQKLNQSIETKTVPENSSDKANKNVEQEIPVTGGRQTTENANLNKEPGFKKFRVSEEKIATKDQPGSQKAVENQITYQQLDKIYSSENSKTTRKKGYLKKVAQALGFNLGGSGKGLRSDQAGRKGSSEIRKRNAANFSEGKSEGMVQTVVPVLPQNLESSGQGSNPDGGNYVNSEVILESPTVLDSAKTSLLKYQEKAIDILSQVSENYSEDQESWRMKGRWNLGFSGGTILQNSVLKGSFNSSYSPGKSSAAYRFNENSIQQPLMASLQINRFGLITSSFQIGARIRLGWMYQSLEAEQEAAVNSGSRFIVSSDSLSVRAISLVENKKLNFTRHTFLADMGFQFLWKPEKSPIGINVHLPTLRYQYSSGKNGLPQISEWQFFITPPDLKIFLPITAKMEFYVEGMIISWQDYNLPVPIKSTGRNLALSAGFGWIW